MWYLFIGKIVFTTLSVVHGHFLGDTADDKAIVL